jgi:hypothetical protein
MGFRIGFAESVAMTFPELVFRASGHSLFGQLSFFIVCARSHAAADWTIYTGALRNSTFVFYDSALLVNVDDLLLSMAA